MKITNALLSSARKTELATSVERLVRLSVNLYASEGTAAYIRSLGYEVTTVTDLTGYPPILGGRVKTLHPAIFGGILADSAQEGHEADLAAHNLVRFDFVFVDLYPFEETIAAPDVSDAQAIEKIDIGGVALLRAAAKNFNNVVAVGLFEDFEGILNEIERQAGTSTLAQRRIWAGNVFEYITEYDRAIANYFKPSPKQILRYGENPQQTAYFLGDLQQLFHQESGKELSYNNLLDLDGGLRLLADLADNNKINFVIIKHTNPCGVARRADIQTAWEAALASDPISAFGGVLCTDACIDLETAKSISNLFFEILCAPDYTPDALDILTRNNKRIILRQKNIRLAKELKRTALHGELVQTADGNADDNDERNYKVVTTRIPTDVELKEARFAEIIAKHLKSNALAITKHEQLIGIGTGQTSRVKSAQLAIEQAQASAIEYGFTLQDCALASDGFLPFDDVVKLAHQAGISIIIQPGGSVRDQDSIEYCNLHNLCMIFTGKRHFKH